MVLSEEGTWRRVVGLLFGDWQVKRDDGEWGEDDFDGEIGLGWSGGPLAKQGHRSPPLLAQTPSEACQQISAITNV